MWQRLELVAEPLLRDPAVPLLKYLTENSSLDCVVLKGVVL